MDGGGLGMPMGKRLGPDDVPPVIIGNTRFEVIHWGRARGLEQNGGYIAAYDVLNGSELWMLKVYHIEYDEKMESDVQDVFIESLSKGIAKETIDVMDEMNRRYIVNLKTRTVEAYQISRSSELCFPYKLK